ncbi:esterase family protein [Nocardia sp. CT2-14]|uniref:Esterase family protein n=2 Tax=Nocardia aurantiaca TaxID=2675850 RepID=A0A6I3KRU7_9NOCA|nr:esterase family protein [Nocardia aurantiaca]
MAPLGVSLLGTTAAHAAFSPDGMDFYVDSATMGPIKSRVFRAADGNTNRVVYALDGERARDDDNGWEINTDVAHALTAANINVVMPVGGQSSWYADWKSPSTFLGVPAGTAAVQSGSGVTQALSGGPGKSYTYKWETFLSQELPNALRDRLGFSSTRNGIFGLSMSGGSALMLAAFHPSQFAYAGSLSGALDLSLPGMRDAIRVAMVDAGGYNVDALAGPKDLTWQHLDPFQFAPKLKANGTRMFISAGSGLPASTDAITTSTIQAMGIEAVALVGTKAFQSRWSALGGGNVVYDFPAVGVHNWRNWESELGRMLPDLSANIG